jgi:hypothetical protein
LKGKGGKATELILGKFIQDMKINIFSFMLAIQKGASLHSEGTSFILSKGERKHMKLETFHRMQDILHSTLQSSQQENRVCSSLDVFKTARIACWTRFERRTSKSCLIESPRLQGGA